MEKIKWIPKSELIESESTFKVCPVCRGKVIQFVAKGGIWGVKRLNPQCKQCGRKFKPSYKLGHGRGYKILDPKGG